MDAPRYASEQMLRSMLKDRGAKAVYRALTKRGYTVPRQHLDLLRASMVAAGEARSLARGERSTAPVVSVEAPIAPWIDPSERLLGRVTALYARTAAARGCSPEAAQILLNYSPAQIQRMAA